MSIDDRANWAHSGRVNNYSNGDGFSTGSHFYAGAMGEKRVGLVIFSFLHPFSRDRAPKWTAGAIHAVPPCVLSCDQSKSDSGSGSPRHRITW